MQQATRSINDIAVRSAGVAPQRASLHAAVAVPHTAAALQPHTAAVAQQFARQVAYHGKPGRAAPTAVEADRMSGQLAHGRNTHPASPHKPAIHPTSSQASIPLPPPLERGQAQPACSFGTACSARLARAWLGLGAGHAPDALAWVLRGTRTL